MRRCEKRRSRWGTFLFVAKFILYILLKSTATMINFASLFNQYRQQSNSGLNELLDQPDLSIGRVLDDDSFIGEYKSSNPKVTQFMTYLRFNELIDFVTVIPGPEDKKRAYKYPLAACDLLSLDVPNAIDFFLPENPLTIDETTQQLQEFQVEVQIQEPTPSTSEQPQEVSTVEPEALVAVTQGVKLEEEVKKPEEEKIQERAVVDKEDDNIEILGEEDKEKPEVLEGEKKEQAKEDSKEDAEQEKKEEVKVVKTIIKKEMRTVQKVNKKEVPPLIIKLLSYFKGEVNYTLAGYVCKILSQFFNKKPSELFKYLFQQPMIEKILNHAESRSVGDFLVKILTYQSPLCMEKRGQLFKAMLTRLSVPSEITTMSNISAYACEVIEKVAANLKSNNKIPEFSAAYLSLVTVTTLINSVMSPEESVSVYNAPVLFTYLATVPFILPEDQQVINDFTSLLTDFVDKSCEKLTVKSSSQPKLGVGRVKIVQILRHIIKEDVLKARQIVAAKQNFFPTLYNLMLEYDLNNLLHNEIIKILEVALQEPKDSPLNSSVLKDNQLLDLIVNEAKEDSKIRHGSSTYKHRKGYIAHLINLCLKLKELSPSNSLIQDITENIEFTKVFEGLIEKEVYNTKQSLAGYSMRKDLKHEILFQKEDIISAHLTFFQKCPSPVFDQEPDHLTNDHINIEHPDLLQELEKQLEENVSIQSSEEKKKPEEKSEEIKKEKKDKSKLKKAGYENTPNFWVVHLDYDVDNLLIDL